MYRPNFCCQCGERILRERWRLWTSRRYCEACAKVLQKPQLVAPFLAGLVLVCIGLIAGKWTQPEQPPLLEKSSLVTLTSTPKTQSANNKTQANTSTQTNTNTQANINTQPAPLESEQPAYYCGARTQKGTPCMRRVRGAIRCWQHEGKPPMMPQEKLLISDK